MIGTDVEDLTLNLIFEFVIYNGYTRNALKDYHGETIPSIGITHEYFCPYHERREWLTFIDIDEKPALNKLKKILIRTLLTTQISEHLLIARNIVPVSNNRFIPLERKTNDIGYTSILPSFIISESKYGFHVIVVSHKISSASEQTIREEITKELEKNKIKVDRYHQLIGEKRGKIILRIFGKYKDKPEITVREVFKKYDPVTQELLKLYDVSRWLKIWANLTLSSSQNTF
ncbi:hypothetical protein SBFV2_gp61 [Sulfolobales Beppu filamentous virus 2]|uniref:Uncharacterized protein n=1 Tax=Sulfolobales Beppu filamentous virus 2 TaxID=2493123 RepID=A0A3Q8Q3U3_9VIRU|nr:hypothetical protein HOU84_gp61 [Sulfolobales Beppu filamentous virus 2]AZI75828.1 hypothetical protein SBFV2_gp61 [Sulfolobales Beppu filamentous virus 2]